MLSFLLAQHEGDLTVLVVDPQVLDRRGVVVADRNAASAARFEPAAIGIGLLDETAVYAEWWQDLDSKQRRMAEVLVPNRVPAMLVRGAYVPNPAVAQRLRAELSDRELPIAVHRFLFFERP